MEAHARVNAKATAELTVTTYPKTLLDTAEGLLTQGQFGIATVVAHIACEVATERTLTEAFKSKGIEYLEDSVLECLNGYSLANDRNLRLYVALTQDEIQMQPFWKEYKSSAARRNAVIHQGKLCTQDQAKLSIAAAKAVVRHLQK